MRIITRIIGFTALLFVLGSGQGSPARAADWTPPPAITDPAFPPLLVGANGQRGAGTPLEGVHRIICIGDSVTEYGDGPTGWVGIMRANLATAAAPDKIEVLDVGKDGNTSRDELERFDTDVMAKKPDLVLINSGLDDAWFGFSGDHPRGGGWRSVPLDEFRQNVDKMVTMAQKAGARVMVLSTTICSEDKNSPQNVLLMTYNQALRDIAHRRGCVFVDLQPPFRTYLSTYHATGGTDYTLTVDGVNLSNAGDRLMADTVLTALLRPRPRGVR